MNLLKCLSELRAWKAKKDQDSLAARSGHSEALRRHMEGEEIEAEAVLLEVSVASGNQVNVCFWFLQQQQYQ